jgi:hypothetical protein
MNSTDSINSYSGAQYSHPNPGCGTPGAHSPRDKLPKDVLEALDDDDLEKAMALLKEQSTAESDSFNKYLANLMTGMLKLLSFNFIVAEPKARMPGRGKNSQGNFVKSQQRSFQEIFKGLGKVLAVSMKKGALAARFAAKNLLKGGHAAGRYFLKPAAKLISKGLIKSYIVLRDRFNALPKAFEKFSSQFKSRYEKTRVKTAEKFESAAKEIRELAKPVKKWLTDKFENFAEKQGWAKEALGQNVQALVHVANVMINLMAYSTIPFAFGLKQGRKGEKFLKKGLKKLKGAFNKVKGGFQRGKKWLKRKMKRGYVYFQAAVETCVFAVERIWLLFIRKVIAFLKKLMRWAAASLRLFPKRIKSLVIRLRRLIAISNER